MLILSPEKKEKIDSKEPKNRQNLSCARGLLKSEHIKRRHIVFSRSVHRKHGRLFNCLSFPIDRNVFEGRFYPVYFDIHDLNLKGMKGAIKEKFLSDLEKHPSFSKNGKDQDVIKKVLSACGRILDTANTLRNHRSLAHSTLLMYEVDASFGMGIALEFMKYIHVI